MGTSNINMATYSFGTTTTIAPGWGNDANATMDAKLHKNVATYAQTIACTVSFSSHVYFTNNFPTTPSSAPTTDYQVANKKYVDDKVILTNVPLYENTRVGDFAFQSNDEYLLESTATVSSKYCYVYPPLKGTCTKIEVDAKESVQCGGTSSFRFYLEGKLQSIVDGGTWTDCTNGTTSVYYDKSSNGATNTDLHLIINPTLSMTYEKQYRVQLRKYASQLEETGGVTTFFMFIYSFVLTQ